MARAMPTSASMAPACNAPPPPPQSAPVPGNDDAEPAAPPPSENVKPKGLAIPLYLDHDENCLTAYQCFLRKQIELFEAGDDELSGTGKKVGSWKVLVSVPIAFIQLTLFDFSSRQKHTLESWPNRNKVPSLRPHSKKKQDTRRSLLLQNN